MLPESGSDVGNEALEMEVRTGLNGNSATSLHNRVASHWTDGRYHSSFKRLSAACSRVTSIYGVYKELSS